MLILDDSGSMSLSSNPTARKSLFEARLVVDGSIKLGRDGKRWVNLERSEQTSKSLFAFFWEDRLAPYKRYQDAFNLGW